MNSAELKTKMEAAGVSPEKLAGEASVSFQTVKRAIAGKHLQPAMEKAILDAIVRLSAAKAVPSGR